MSANLVAAAVSSVTERMYLELSPIRIALFSVGASLVAGLLFCVVARRSPKPTLPFAAAILVAASLSSAWLVTSRPASFAQIAIPAQFTLALVMIAVVPRLALAPGRRSPARPTRQVQ